MTRDLSLSSSARKHKYAMRLKKFKTFIILSNYTSFSFLIFYFRVCFFIAICVFPSAFFSLLLPIDSIV